MGSTKAEKAPGGVAGSVHDLASVLVVMAINQAVGYPLGLGSTAALSMGIQILAWIPSAMTKNERFYDFMGMVGFVTLSVLSQMSFMERFLPGVDGSPTHWLPRHVVATSMVLIWTLRLGMFLFQRILKDGHDARFNGVRHRPLKFLMFWAVQGMWVFFTPLPMFALHQLDPNSDAGSIGLREALGLLIWVAGFVLEVVADEQKRAFKANPDNRGQFIDVGLWARCRHPNYLGEMTIWVGFFVFCSRGLLEGIGWVVLAGPAFVICLLVFISTPMIEEGADKRYGSRPGYEDYKKKTPCLMMRLR